MRNALNLFRSDVRHIFTNVMSTIIVLGLVILPSIFTWYNVLACWDVFGNTGNLKVAVANVDAGYTSDLMPIEVNIGSKVESALRANDQIDWVFTDEEDAIDGAASGRYYAAVVIPESFSKDMLTFYQDDATHADIVYYTNEKKNAVSPKITTSGVDTVAYTINATFAQTLAEVSVALAQQISSYADSDDAQSMIARVTSDIRLMSSRMGQTSSVLDLYANVLRSGQGIVSSSSQLLETAEDGAASLTETTRQTIANSLTHVQNVLDAYDAAYEKMIDAQEDLSEVDATMIQTYPTAEDAQDMADQLRKDAEEIDEQLKIPTLTDEQRAALEQTRDYLLSLADSIEMGEITTGDMETLELAIATVKALLEDTTSTYQESLRPSIVQLRSDLQGTEADIAAAADAIASAGEGLSQTVDSVSVKLDDALSKLEKATSNLKEVSGKLGDLADAVDEALASDDLNTIKQLLSGDSSALATALSTPVEVERNAVFAVENFGSAMTPLYATLALFIGALLIMVVIKPTVSEQAIRDLGPDANPKPRQLFAGRYGIVGLIALYQSLLLCLGNMFFLQVQVSDPLLFILCYLVTGQVFAFMVYTLVVSFANLGKGITVILLIIQVTGCNGSFPLSILPDFVQALSPWLPATHVVSAMRAAMMGVYLNDFWIEMGILLLFLVPFVLLGFILRKPTEKFMHWYIEKVEDSNLMA